MDKVLKLIIVGIALLCNLQVDAQTYRLYGVSANAGKKTIPRPRTPECPLVIELADNVMMIPNQVIGFTLILENADGHVYTYHIVDRAIVLPKDISGTYQVSITDGDKCYQGYVEF